MGSRYRVLVADPLAAEGIRYLEARAETDERYGLSGEELGHLLPGYHGLIVRSETQVSRDVIRAATELRVVGRAGVGVDNIDVDAASERGIVVVNAPAGNTISAAELTLALLLALSRHLVQSDASLRRGEWSRQKYVGVELRGKTAGVIGLGQVGSEVARRLRALEMSVLGHDPFVPAERARMLGAEPVDLEELLTRSDFVTLHTKLTPETRHLIGEPEFASMKPDARLVNTARGGLVNESALLRALDSGRLAGAALDVFETEPLPEHHPVTRHRKVICTPHLGASTVEAQERVSLDVAREVMQVLGGRPATTAVNAPMPDPDTMEAVGPYLSVAEMCGTVVTQLAKESWHQIELDFLGGLSDYDSVALRAAAVAGLLSTISEEQVNLASLPHVLKRRGWTVTERKGSEAGPYSNLIRIRLKGPGVEVAAAGTLVHGEPHLTSVDGFEVDVSPGSLGRGRGHLLIVYNEDRPGRVGAVGTALGEMDINISQMAVGRRDPAEAIMVLGVNRELRPEQLDELKAIPGIAKLIQVRIE